MADSMRAMLLVANGPHYFSFYPHMVTSELFCPMSYTIKKETRQYLFLGDNMLQLMSKFRNIQLTDRDR